MTSIVPALVPASPADAASGQAASRRPVRGPLPLPTFADRRTRQTVYALPAIDCNGRLADQAIVRVMGWKPGTRYAIQEHGGLLVVDANPRGVFTVTRQGHLYIPAVVRRRCAISPADRLLIAAEPEERRLVIHPPAALDVMIGDRHRAVLGGDAT
ncbi:AbrB/MazE/SpoVT family DNA-binding domain-containing protein [Dactylosporangium sp. NPDC051485]|uniref:AbrB/MazE/SpoVT family DNA-binding domain-containing protein n=1 Tax=Dactylosporangium sp. NPDC051485 TaxID=3154846 RepID=UPI00342443D1